MGATIGTGGADGTLEHGVLRFAIFGGRGGIGIRRTGVPSLGGIGARRGRRGVRDCHGLGRGLAGTTTGLTFPTTGPDIIN